MGLTTHETRRLRGDLIQMYKYSRTQHLSQRQATVLKHLQSNTVERMSMHIVSSCETLTPGIDCLRKLLLQNSQHSQDQNWQISQHKVPKLDVQISSPYDIYRCGWLQLLILVLNAEILQTRLSHQWVNSLRTINFNLNLVTGSTRVCSPLLWYHTGTWKEITPWSFSQDYVAIWFVRLVTIGRHAGWSSGCPLPWLEAMLPLSGEGQVVEFFHDH